MSSERRAAVLGAAVEVLGTGGARALTHRAVDRAAGVPQGTTSNHFRTRDALVRGLLEHISQAESAPLHGPLPADVDGLVALLCERITFLLGEGRSLTVARQALFLEAALHPELRPGLLAASQFWWVLGAEALHALGVPDSRRRSRWLLAWVDGLLADQLARPEADFDCEAAVRAALCGLLDGAS